MRLGIPRAVGLLALLPRVDLAAPREEEMIQTLLVERRLRLRPAAFSYQADI